MPLFAFCLLTVNYTPAAASSSLLPPCTHLPHLLQPHCCCLFGVCDACVAHTPRVTGILAHATCLFLYANWLAKGRAGGSRVGKGKRREGGVAWKTFAVTDRELREQGSGSVRVFEFAFAFASQLISVPHCCCCCCRCCCCCHLLSLAVSSLLL